MEIEEKMEKEIIKMMRMNNLHLKEGEPKELMTQTTPARNL